MRAERRAPLDEAAEREARDLGRRCARWVQDNTEALRECRPTMPAALFNRAGDNWRCLFAIAEIAGGEWPARIAAASAAMAPDDDADGRGIRLLTDIRSVLADHPGATIPSAALCEGLLGLETAGWGEINRGRPLTPATLARMLKPFKVVANTIRTGDRTPRGYPVSAFAEAFRRYLDDDRGGEPTYEVQQRHNPQKSAKNAETKVQHAIPMLHFENPEKPQSPAACGVVALCMGETPQRSDEAAQTGWESGL
jgi:putative DNA primase/helicase